MTSLDLALIGNGTISALVDRRGEIVWACFPRFDGDPAFCSLLRERARDDDCGFLAVELVDAAVEEQEYLANTPILITRLHDRHGGAVEVTTGSSERGWRRAERRALGWCLPPYTMSPHAARRATRAPI